MSARARLPWPMVLFVGVLLALGLAFAYVLIWTRITDGGRLPGPWSLIVTIAPFAMAIAGIRAIIDQRRDDARREAEARAAGKVSMQDMLAPRPAEPVARGVGGDDPFRSPPRAAPIVASTPAPVAASAAPVVVASDAPPPKLLT